MKTKRNFLLATVVLSMVVPVISVQAQFLWAERVASIMSFPEGEPNVGLALDADDNCYVTGFFDDTNDFGGVTLTNQSSGGPDIFIAKYDATGGLQWVEQAGGTTVNYGRAVGLDTNGNIYVTGGYSGSANFSGTGLPAGLGEEFFLAKYDNTGALQWVQPSTGGFDDNDGIGLAVDSAGNSYALAVMDHSGSSITFGSVTANANNGGTTFLILVKYDTTGTAQWAQLFDTSQETYGSKVAVDTDGNVYVRGLFESDMEIGSTNFSATASENPFLAKFDGSGNLIWIRQPTGESGEGGVAVDPVGNVYTAGAFTGTLSFGSGISLTSTASKSALFGDAFVAKYDSSGAIQWAKAAGGTGGGLYWDVALDARTNLYVAGFLGSDAAVSEYSPAGTLEWTESASGSGGAAKPPVASGMAKCDVDPSGNCFLAGFYQGTATLGKEPLIPQETWNYFLTEVTQSAAASNATLSAVVSPPDTGTVSPNYNDQSLQVGKNYTMSAKAAKGCKFIGWTGSTNTASEKISFVMEPGLSFTANCEDITRPTLAVLSPKAKQTITSSVITATGKAKDNVAVTAVYCQLNSNAWESAPGTNDWSATNLVLAPGTNVIRAYALDAAGNASLTNSIAFNYKIAYTGVYVGQTNDDPSGPGGFALFVDAKQNALLIGGDPYNNDSGDAVYASCVIGADGSGQSDVNGNPVSFTISTNGSVAVISDAFDSGEVVGSQVSSGPFLSVAGAYSTSVSGQTVQAILSPDGSFYTSSPDHNGGGACQFTSYGIAVTEIALGHTVSTLTLNANATITDTVTNNNVAGVYTLKRVDALP